MGDLDDREFRWIQPWNSPTDDNLSIVYQFLDYWKRPIVLEEFIYWFEDESENLILEFISKLRNGDSRSDGWTKLFDTTIAQREVSVEAVYFAFLQESRQAMVDFQQSLAKMAFTLRQMQSLSRKTTPKKDD